MGYNGKHDELEELAPGSGGIAQDGVDNNPQEDAWWWWWRMDALGLGSGERLIEIIVATGGI